MLIDVCKNLRGAINLFRFLVEKIQSTKSKKNRFLSFLLIFSFPVPYGIMCQRKLLNIGERIYFFIYFFFFNKVVDVSMNLISLVRSIISVRRKNMHLIYSCVNRLKRSTDIVKFLSLFSF